MTIQNQTPVYNLNIDSLEDLEQAINHSENEISNILDEKYFFGAERIAKILQISHLFKVAYCGSHGLSTCPQVAAGIDHYQTLLKNSITICEDILTPLLISSFKCLQRAKHQYTTTNERDSAMNLMAESGHIAKKISSEYKKLSEEFNTLSDTEKEDVDTLVNDRAPILAEQSEFQATNGEDTTTGVLKVHILKRNISSLDSSIESLRKIRTALLKAVLFWSETEEHSKALTNPDLANPIKVKALIDQEAEDYETAPESQEIIIDLSMFDDQHQNTFETPLKTGCDRLIPFEPPIKNLTKLLKSIEAKFEQSYLSWLALAKVNQTMITAMKTTLVEVEETQNAIIRIKNNPLYRASKKIKTSELA